MALVVGGSVTAAVSLGFVHVSRCKCISAVGFSLTMDSCPLREKGREKQRPVINVLILALMDGPEGKWKLLIKI